MTTHSRILLHPGEPFLYAAIELERIQAEGSGNRSRFHVCAQSLLNYHQQFVNEQKRYPEFWWLGQEVGIVDGVRAFRNNPLMPIPEIYDTLPRAIARFRRISVPEARITLRQHTWLVHFCLALNNAFREEDQRIWEERRSYNPFRRDFAQVA